jgi:hypothetical protein
VRLFPTLWPHTNLNREFRFPALTRLRFSQRRARRYWPRRRRRYDRTLRLPKTPVLRGLNKLGLTPVSRTLSLCTCCRHHPAQRLDGFTRQPGRGRLSPKGSSGRLAHRRFRGAHSRYVPEPSLCHQLVSRFYEGFSSFVPSIAAPASASTAWGPASRWKAPPCHDAHPKPDRFVNRGYLSSTFLLL